MRLIRIAVATFLAFFVVSIALFLLSEITVGLLGPGDSIGIFQHQIDVSSPAELREKGIDKVEDLVDAPAVLASLLAILIINDSPVNALFDIRTPSLMLVVAFPAVFVFWGLFLFRRTTVLMRTAAGMVCGGFWALIFLRPTLLFTQIGFGGWVLILFTFLGAGSAGGATYGLISQHWEAILAKANPGMARVVLGLTWLFRSKARGAASGFVLGWLLDGVVLGLICAVAGNAVAWKLSRVAQPPKSAEISG